MRLTSPAGAIPAGAIPACAIPACAIPACAIPAGAIPACAIPAGAIPACATGEVHPLMSAGRGPQECAWAMAKLLDRPEGGAVRAGLSVQQVQTVSGDRRGTYRSVLLRIHGRAAEDFAGSWTGTLCRQAPSPYRRGTGRKNWYVIARPCAVDAGRRGAPTALPGS